MKEGQSGKITGIDLPKEIRHRMMELGFRKGMVVSVVGKFGRNFMVRTVGSTSIAVSDEVLDGISIVLSSV